MDGAKLRHKPFVLSGLDQLQKQPGAYGAPGEASWLGLQVSSDQIHGRLVTLPHCENVLALANVQDLVSAHEEVEAVLVHTASVNTVEAGRLDDLEARSERVSETPV